MTVHPLQLYRDLNVLIKFTLKNDMNKGLLLISNNKIDNVVIIISALKLSNKYMHFVILS